ncbi:hypothetical protein TNCT_441191 [Trichonephila clavata]|uniref:Uncharacterized protein n=1 Tax=Trichonephila clavata TaxID=2740835 RepID=A0A8X6LT10_TRICU|nr:hypothetical protein TNCT_441191 [Trichonephila clavata]
MELEGIRVAKNMMTTKENIVLPPPMERNGLPPLPPEAANFFWADRVENSTPSLSPGSLCLDGGQIPSISPVREQQIESIKMTSLNALQQACSDSARFFIMKTVNTFSAVSPFLIEKAITSSIGQVKTIRKMRSGDLFLEVTSAK